MAEYKSEQRKLNERAIKIGMKIRKSPRYWIEASDGTSYYVDKRPELYALITNFEKEHDGR